MAAAKKPWLIVVGAGPSGLLLALMLAKRGVQVLVLEASNVLDDSPRAAYYGPPAAYELDRAGVLHEIRLQGFDPIITCWRKLDGTYLAGWDCSVVKDDFDRLACMPLAQLDQLLYRHATALPNVEVLFSHKVVDLGQDEQQAWVDAETPEGTKRFEADYIVGCDGGGSTVRRKLFGGRDFPGWTWDKQIVATNVSCSFKMFFVADRYRCRILSRSWDMKTSSSSFILSTTTWWRV
jgi:2-polyprenyl-6-methoxyphenol hydroxylase-like FAD-dependent oxidoreductase